MSISDINIIVHRGNIRKTVLASLVFAMAAVAIDRIYALFGHGVSSAFMTWVFLYPLLGGALVYLLIAVSARLVIGAPGYRLFCNIYNSGIATLAAGSLLRGILEIAGTGSPYTALFFAAGGLLTAGGLGLLLALFIRYR